MLAIVLIVVIPAVVICLIIAIYSFIKAIISKICFYNSIKKICSTNHVILRFNRRFMASFFKFSSHPDLIIELPKKKYNIRLMICKNKHRYYVFPSEEYYISFERIISSFNPTGKFQHIPSFDQKYHHDNQSENILLFLPFTPKISVLNDNHTKRILLGETRQIFGWSVYTPTSFIDELNRIVLSQKSEEPKC